MLTIIAQYLAALFTLNPERKFREVLLDPNLHLIVLATVLLTAAGFIINAFYDLEKDLVNRPQRTVFDRLISKNTSLNIYFLLNFTGLGLAWMASFNIFIYFFIFTVGLWFYSHKLQKIAVLGEVSASLLTVSSFFSIGLYFHHIQWMHILYGSWVMLLIFSRELIKGIQDIKGDALFGYNSIPLQLGLAGTKKLLYLLLTMAFIPLGYVFISYDAILFRILMALSAAVVMQSVFLLNRANSSENMSGINMRLKILIITSVMMIAFL